MKYLQCLALALITLCPLAEGAKAEVVTTNCGCAVEACPCKKPCCPQKRGIFSMILHAPADAWDSIIK